MSELYGSKPGVPRLEKLSLGDEQLRAISDNIAAEPGARQLANLTMDQIMSMLERVDPNFQGKADKISGNIDDLLAGKIPQDVQDERIRGSVGRALEGGYGGTGMERALVGRDLGLTSLDLTGRGLSQAESWLGSVERLLSPAMATYTGMFVTPMQEYETHNEQNMQEFQRKWMKNQIAAMPDPLIKGLYDTTMQLSGRGNGPQQNPTPQNNVGNWKPAGDTSDWSSGWQSSGPITSPGMSYDLGAGASGADFGSAFSTGMTL